MGLLLLGGAGRGMRQRKRRTARLLDQTRSGRKQDAPTNAYRLFFLSGQETWGSQTPVRKTLHPKKAVREATGGCVFRHGRAVVVIIAALWPRSVKFGSLFVSSCCFAFYFWSRMSSPLFLRQLVGVPLEIMHPTMEKDTTYTKIFVGGLPYHTNDASLRKYFETFGDIDEAVVITDKQTGKSRGYGFVSSS